MFRVKKQKHSVIASEAKQSPELATTLCVRHGAWGLLRFARNDTVRSRG